MTEPLQRLFVDVLFGNPPDPSDPQALRTWLEHRNIADRDIEAILASDLSGLYVYRQLARQTLHGAFERALPLTLSRLGVRFACEFSEFLAARGTRTHFLREVVREFVEWAAPRWRASDPGAGVADHIPDLAEYEALRFELASTAEVATASPETDLTLERRVRFSAACHLPHYDFAVQRLTLDQPAQAPERASTDLCVYRAPDHTLHTLELTALAAAILRQLSAGATLGSAVELACAAAGSAVDESVLDGTAQLLADLAGRGAIVGAF